MDVKNRCWSKEMCEICGITTDMLPKLYESYECVGTVLPEIAKELGLSENVKVAAGAGDNAAAAVATGTVGDATFHLEQVERSLFLLQNLVWISTMHYMHSVMQMELII